MTQPDFDRIARAYRWMEYLTLGRRLERTRWWFVDQARLDGCRKALVLGDGDGRFTERLLRRNAAVQVTAVDLSVGMLRELERRCGFAGDRLATVRGDVREYSPEAGIDFVATHFLLDCLTQAEVDVLVGRVAPGLSDGAVWVVSEFRVPEGWLTWPARVLVRGLYLAFRVLTGLRATRLPDHGASLRGCGWGLMEEKRFLGGVLVTELWGKA